MLDKLSLETGAAGAAYLEEGHVSLAESMCRNIEQNKRVRKLVSILEDTSMNNFRFSIALREAMTTDSFPLTFGDSLSREMRARYQVAQPDMLRICRRSTVPDFRAKKSFRYDGMTGRLQKVEEKGEYLAAELTENRKTYSVYKYGRQADFGWEAYINDDLGLFGDIAQRFVDACINTLEYFITSLLMDATGPIDATFAIATATNALTIGNLETGVEAMNSQVLATSTGNVPIKATPKYLMVGPALEFTARQILTSTVKTWQQDTDSTVAAFALPTNNVVGQIGLELIVNPWVPIIDTTSGTTAWYLFSDPRDIAIAEVGFLRGHEAPEVHMKKSDLMVVGGGEESPYAGDFATDNIYYRVRYVLGGVALEDTAGYASTGAG